MNRKPLPALFSTFLIAGFASCRALLPDMHVERAESLPAAYAAVSNASTVTTNAWWTEFGSEEMNRLMDRALRGNLTVARAAARLRQAWAVALKAGAARLPEVSASAGAETGRRRDVQDQKPATEDVESYSLGLAASYEVDLWGRVLATRQSAELDAAASRLDLETAAMTIAAQVADRWIQLVEARLQDKLVAGQLDTNTRVLELLKKRVGKSSTRPLDVYQQEQSVLAVEAARPLLEQRVALLENELAVLLGLPAGTDLELVEASLPPLPAQPETGLPADLLIQRPDVRAGLLRLKAGGWDVAAARADRFPALRLTSSASTQAGDTAGLFDNWLVNLAAGLTAPLLDGGRRRAELDRTKARLGEHLAAYRQVILDAVREVEDALIRERSLQRREEALDRQLQSARRVLQEAERGYLSGASDYVSVLIALRSLQQSERDVLSAQRELLSNRVSLYRALGGSWASRAADDAARRGDVLGRDEPSPERPDSTGGQGE